MRVVYAWFLLLVSVSNWIGGHICFEVSYWVETEEEMDEQEQQIARELHAELGIEGWVKIVDPNELSPRGKFYNTFSFSTEMDGRTVFYSLENESEQSKLDEVVAKNEIPSKQDNKTLLLKSLFKEFPVQEIPELNLSEIATLSISIYYHFLHPGLTDISIPSPPPDFS